jgi:hypothetical protein
MPAVRAAGSRGSSMRRVLGSLAAAALVVAGCGGGNDTTDPTEAPDAEVLALDDITTSSDGAGGGEVGPVAAGDALFAFERYEGSGAGAVWFVRGECSEGGLPTGVTITPAQSAAIALDDLGEGLFSFPFGVPATSDLADPGTVSSTLAEIGIPEQLGQDGNRAMQGTCG